MDAIVSIRKASILKINEKSSSPGRLQFGVPQGSILGPILFNLYVTDLQDQVDGSICQYADDTTSYEHCKLSNISDCMNKLTNQMESLHNWSNVVYNLALNPNKSKFMPFSTNQLSRRHDLDKQMLNIDYNNSSIERVKTWKILGIHFDQHLNWNEHFEKLLKSTNKKLHQLRKLKRFTLFHIRKQLAQALIISIHNAPQYRIDRLQQLLKSTMAFVTGKYCTTLDVINLK